MLTRTIGADAQQVCFQINPSAGPETFTVAGTPGAITIHATSPSAATEGAGWYLKYVVHADEGMGNFTPKVPRILPAPSGTITETSGAPNRYEGNDTQDGYTNPDMSWPEWQNMLDMYALHGVNEVYVLPGTDAVYAQVLQDFGYTADQARAWVPLPALQPWWAMQNVSSDSAPISQALLDSRAALARKIIDRCKQLGITPVIPGFYGTVPTDFAAKNPTADGGAPPYVIAQGTWNAAQRPSWLAPTDPLFALVATDYYKHADTLLGASGMYRMNPLQEGGNSGTVDPGAAANAIMTALQTAEPGATWMQLGWSGNPGSKELQGLSSEQLSHLLIADGTTDTGSTMPNRDANWPNTNWLFGTIPFGGGQTSMGANGQVWLDRYYAEAAKTGGRMTGFAFQPEGINDPAAFELMAEIPWHASQFGLKDWLTQYAQDRYGTSKASAAWSAIATAYSSPVTCCGQESLLGLSPNLATGRSPAHDAATFATALPLLTSAAPSVVQSAAYDYDLADVANQVITDWTDTELPQIDKAYQAKDLATFNSLTATWLQAMNLDDQALGTVPAFMLGTYVKDSLSAGSTSAESATLRSDLLHLWTTWFSNVSTTGNGSLNNYASHVLSGMVSGYYEPNWQLYFSSLSTALATNQPPAAINWLQRGDTFASAATSFPTVPRGNTAAIAGQIDKLLSIAPIVSPAFTSPINGSALATSPTSVAGTGVAGDAVAVTENGAAVCSATVAADSTWNCAPTAPLPTGSQTLSAVQSTADGYRSNPATVAFAVGTAPRLADNWTFDSQTGAVVQDNGADHYDATITGSTTLAPGITGDAAKFDGTVAPITTSAPNLTTPWAVGAWVNPSATSRSANLLDGTRVQGNSSLKIQQNGASGRVGATEFYVQDYSVDYTAPLNTWTYLTYVDDGTRISVYADGKPVGTIATSFPLSRAAIGSTQSNVGVDVYNGLIDDMSVFSNSLTPDQVAALYASAQTGGTGTARAS